MIANAVSWVIAVKFAFWINRKMVFQVKGGTGASVLRELGEFALGRVLSFALFEEGMAYLLELIGVSNVVNRIIVLVVVMIFNYVVSKFWVFKERNKRRLAAAISIRRCPLSSLHASSLPGRMLLPRNSRFCIRNA